MNIRSRPVPLSRPWLRLCAAVALGVLLAAGLLTSCRSAPQDAKATASVATARTSITTADGITAVTPPDETPLSV